MIQNKKGFGLVVLCALVALSSGASGFQKKSAAGVEGMSFDAEDISSETKDEYGVVYSRDGKSLLKAPQDLIEYRVKDGTEVICDAAFSGSKIEKIVLPSSLKSIRAYAFSEILSLKSLAFADFFSLENIVIPNSVKTIGEYAFKNCEHLKSVKLPQCLKRIEKHTFDCCYDLKSVYIPENLDFIAEDCFDNCYNLERIEVAPSNRKFCSVDGVLYSKDRKTLLVYPAENSGEKVVIAECVEKIAKGAFDSFYNPYNNEPSKTIVIPKNIKDVSEIDFSLFKDIEVADSNPAYCVVDGFLCSKDKKTLVACSGGMAMKETLVIPEGIETIKNGALAGLYSLKTLELPSSILRIEKDAFAEAENDDDTSELQIKSILIPKGTLAKFQKVIAPKYHPLIVEGDFSSFFSLLIFRKICI